MNRDADADGDSAPGTYVLLVDLAEPAIIEFGAAGRFDLASGRYAYVGSAFGPGGLSRVQRHRELADESRDTRHWHVDYLLGHAASTIEVILTETGVDRECTVASALAESGEVLPLGASDCGCTGHLVYDSGAQSLEGIASTVLQG